MIRRSRKERAGKSSYGTAAGINVPELLRLRAGLRSRSISLRPTRCPPGGRPGAPIGSTPTGRKDLNPKPFGL
jgi:hypothetical protein